MRRVSFPATLRPDLAFIAKVRVNFHRKEFANFLWKCLDSFTEREISKCWWVLPPMAGRSGKLMQARLPINWTRPAVRESCGSAASGCVPDHPLSVGPQCQCRGASDDRSMTLKLDVGSSTDGWVGLNRSGEWHVFNEHKPTRRLEFPFGWCALCSLAVKKVSLCSDWRGGAEISSCEESYHLWCSFLKLFTHRCSNKNNFPFCVNYLSMFNFLLFHKSKI